MSLSSVESNTALPVKTSANQQKSQTSEGKAEQRSTADKPVGDSVTLRHAGRTEVSAASANESTAQEAYTLLNATKNKISERGSEALAIQANQQPEAASALLRDVS